MKQFSSVVAKIKNSDGVYESIPALRGMSSYEVAKAAGFEGTEQEWLEFMFDDGWVAKFQELEANKANKTDVYTKKEIDYTSKTNNNRISSDITSASSMSSYLALAGNVNEEMTNAALGKNNEDNIIGVGKALALYARFKDPEIDINYEFKELVKCNSLNDVITEAVIHEIQGNSVLHALLYSNDYMYEKVINDNIDTIIYRYQHQNLITGMTCVEMYNNTTTYKPNVNLTEYDGGLALTLPTDTLYDKFVIFCIGNDTFQTNGSKFLNFNIIHTSAILDTYETYHHFGIVNEEGTDFINGKYVDVSTSGRKCIDISGLSNVRVGFKGCGNKGYNGNFCIDDITMSDFEIL